MRVAHTVPNFSPRITGPGQVVERIASHCARRGHDVMVATRQIPGAASREFVADVDVHRVEPGGQHLARVLEAFRPDLVLAHELRNRLTRAAVAWASRHGVRVAVQPHGELAAFRRLPHLHQRLPFQAFDALVGNGVNRAEVDAVATSILEEQEIRGVVGPRRRVVRLYLGTDPSPARGNNAAGASPTVLMLANFGVFRDPRLLLRASEMLRGQRVPHEVVLAGGLEGQSRFTARIPGKDLRGGRYIGPVAPTERARVFALAHAFCYPSRYESFGLPILEAAVAGLPIVAPRVGIMGELATTADFLLEDLAPATIAAALAGTLKELPARSAVARTRSRWLQEWASWERRAEAYRAWIESGDAPPETPPTPLGPPP